MAGPLQALLQSGVDYLVHFCVYAGVFLVPSSYVMLALKVQPALVHFEGVFRKVFFFLPLPLVTAFVFRSNSVSTASAPSLPSLLTQWPFWLVLAMQFGGVAVLSVRPLNCGLR